MCVYICRYIYIYTLQSLVNIYEHKILHWLLIYKNILYRVTLDRVCSVSAMLRYIEEFANNIDEDETENI